MLKPSSWCPSALAQVCNLDGKCVDAAEDEIFSLTTKDGKFAVNRETTTIETAPFDAVITFEQDPNQILDALLPLYMNSQVHSQPAIYSYHA